MYGGEIETVCSTITTYDNVFRGNVSSIAEFTHTQQQNVSVIASDPEEVCICIENEVICHVVSLAASVVPGNL